jgi:hypothetical protein
MNILTRIMGVLWLLAALVALVFFIVGLLKGNIDVVRISIVALIVASATCIPLIWAAEENSF